ncbi:DUF2812 domain-containing protein [Priestia taiwanensis]|uniref:DUF2812 domain-containing protein n=1 Tax=Priestia taiwanensis TaxID=1347902 RepID=A0A917ATU8_9BACI|nr:DUF2812 domain-containing protein [Priestia taiwanensis]MBM7363781.1 hypothetical protein [Priestia taiwanensis]GGE74132.1 hypothetical protein GCM10007140_25050 [Priestia taiwanensis]
MKKVFRLSPHWKSEEEESWLSEMHQQGWMLKKIFVRFQFEYGQPEKVIYKRDLQPGLKKQEREEYIKLYEESGWEYVTKQGDVYYFRISANEADVPELYTDVESKIGQVTKQFKLVAMAYGSVCISSISAFSSTFDAIPWFRILMVFAHIVGVRALWKLWTKRKALEKEVW